MSPLPSAPVPRPQPGLTPAGVPHLSSSLPAAPSKGKRTLPFPMKAHQACSLAHPVASPSRVSSPTLVAAGNLSAKQILGPLPALLTQSLGGGSQKSVFHSLPGGLDALWSVRTRVPGDVQPYQRDIGTEVVTSPTWTSPRLRFNAALALALCPCAVPLPRRCPAFVPVPLLMGVLRL